MDGVMILDKPRGCTSAQALNRVKKAVGVKKAGHTGTLDPFATGVLLCASIKRQKLFLTSETI